MYDATRRRKMRKQRLPIVSYRYLVYYVLTGDAVYGKKTIYFLLNNYLLLSGDLHIPCARVMQERYPHRVVVTTHDPIYLHVRYSFMELKVFRHERVYRLLCFLLCC